VVPVTFPETNQVTWPTAVRRTAMVRQHKSSAVPDTKKKAIAAYRQRMKRPGLVRVEVLVRKEDAPLLRRVAGALADPQRGAETRILLREQFGHRRAEGLKALLAAAPLEGIDLDRVRDAGRAVELGAF
jgi:hypothetical protein